MHRIQKPIILIFRLARNTVTMLETVRELKDINIDVYLERENTHSFSGDGELMLTILASFVQEESRSVSENCKWRIRKGFSEGTHPPIIDIETFQKAQKNIEKNIEQYSGGTSIRKYPFTSKIVCGICGKKYKRKNKQGRITLLKKKAGL